MQKMQNYLKKKTNKQNNESKTEKKKHNQNPNWNVSSREIAKKKTFTFHEIYASQHTSIYSRYIYVSLYIKAK